MDIVIPNRQPAMQTVAEVFDISAPASSRVAVLPPTEYTPAVDKSYAFSKQAVKSVLQWLDGRFERNLLLTGPTGCGKSSLVEQTCARLGIEVWRVACHGRLDFQELLGSTQLVPGAMRDADGLLGKAAAALKSVMGGAEGGESVLQWLQRSFSNTVVSRYVYGPVVMAARRGGVLLLDEANFLHPSTIGAMNTLLDGGLLHIPATGEVVRPAPGFRIAVTGNSMDGGDDMALHKGIQRMNVAFVNRFLALKIDYMPPDQELQVLHSCTKLPGEVLKVLVGVAAETRKSFREGVVATALSTRVMVRWARLVEAQADALTKAPAQLLADTLDFALLNSAADVDRDAIRRNLLKTAEALNVMARKVSPSATAAGGNPVDWHLYVHPNPGKTMPKYWGVIQEGATETVFYGAFDSGLKKETKPAGYLVATRPEKTGKGYQEVTTSMEADPLGALGKALDVIRQTRAGSTSPTGFTEEELALAADMAAKAGRPEWTPRNARRP
jgi:cobaltochelatase CobS